MKRFLLRLTVLLLPVVWACSDSPVEPPDLDHQVAEASSTLAAASEADVQAALDAAAASGTVRRVRLSADLALTSALTYSGSSPLTFDGGGHVVTGPAGDHAFRADGGGDLTFRNVAFVGAPDATSHHGIHAMVPGDATGTFQVKLHRVVLDGFGLSGMWIDDQVHDSDASVQVEIRDSDILDNGFKAAASDALADIEAVLDFDGVRANEGGEGDLFVVIRDSRFVGNAADAFEGDERGSGAAISDVRGSVFSEGGSQPQDIRSCNAYPELVDRADECDDYPDLEDGFDIDEDGDGRLHAVLVGVEAVGNMDEGIDLDELGSGDAELVAIDIEAVGNRDENIKVTESDPEADEADGVDRPGDGDVIVKLRNVTADGSEVGRGTRFEEFGDGDLRGSITASSFSDNTEDDGLRLDEEDEGSIDVALRSVTSNGNDGQGLQVTENEDGTIRLLVTASEFTGNGNTAVEVEEEDDGGPWVTVRGSTLVGEDGEESLEVVEEGDGAGTLAIRGGTVDPAPVVEGDVTVYGTP